MNASLWQLAGWTMIHSLWLGAAVALAGGFLRLACRRATPNTRYAISLATLALLAAAPIAAAAWLSVNGVPLVETALLPLPQGEGRGEGPSQAIALPISPPLPIVEREPDEQLVNHPSPAIIDLAQATPAELDALAAQQQPPQALPTNSPASFPLAPSPLPLPPSDHQSPITSHSPTTYSPTHLLTSSLTAALPLLPTLWLIGAPLTFTLLATGLIGSERLRRRATPLTAGIAFDACQRLRHTLTITRRVALAVSDDVAQPILVGIVRPLILLPAAALAGWTPEQLDMVLLHELAHVRRWDNLINLLQRIVESLLFFHPAVWLVSRQVRRDREECCDAAVIRHTDRPHQYAELLVSIAAALRGGPAPSLAVASAMASHPLAGRIRRILNIEAEPMRITRRTLAATLLLPLLIACAIFYSGASAEDGNNPPPSKGAEQRSTVAGDDRAQGDSPPEAIRGGIPDVDQSNAANGNQASSDALAPETASESNQELPTLVHDPATDLWHPETDRTSPSTQESKRSKSQLEARISELQQLLKKTETEIAELQIFVDLKQLLSPRTEHIDQFLRESSKIDPEVVAAEDLRSSTTLQLQRMLGPAVPIDAAEVQRLQTLRDETTQKIKDLQERFVKVQRKKLDAIPESDFPKVSAANIRKHQELQIKRDVYKLDLALAEKLLSAAKAPPAHATNALNEGAPAAARLPQLGWNESLALKEIVIPFLPDFPDSDQERERIRKQLEADNFKANIATVPNSEAPTYVLRVFVPRDWNPKPVWEEKMGADGTTQKTLRLINEKMVPLPPGALVQPAGHPDSPNQGGEDTGIDASSTDAQGEIPQLQNEIRNLEALIAKTQADLVNIEVFKEISSHSGPGNSALEAAVAEELDRDPTINQYHQQLRELQATHQAKQAESKNSNSLEIKRLRASMQAAEAELAKYRSEAERAVRKKLAKTPNEALRAAMTEYKIRRKAAEANLAEYQQRLIACKQKLAEASAQLDMPQAIGTYPTPTIAAAEAVQQQISEKQQPAQTTILDALDNAKSPAEQQAAFKQLAAAFAPSDANPPMTVIYDAPAGDNMRERIEGIFVSIEKDPYGPQISPSTRRWLNDDRNIEITAPRRAHDLYLHDFFHHLSFFAQIRDVISEPLTTDETATGENSPQPPNQSDEATENLNLGHEALAAVIADAQGRFERQLAELKQRTEGREQTEPEVALNSALQGKILTLQVLEANRKQLQTKRLEDAGAPSTLNLRAAATGSDANDAQPVAKTTPAAAFAPKSRPVTVLAPVADPPPTHPSVLRGLASLEQLSQGPTTAEIQRAFLVRPDNPEVTHKYDVFPSMRQGIADRLEKLATQSSGPHVNVKWEWIDGNTRIQVIAPEEAHQLLFDRPLSGELIDPLHKPTPPSPFPTLENQKIADLAYKLLGVEIDLAPLTAEDLQAVKQLGYDGGVKVIQVAGVHSLQPDDILVGLHVWPVVDASSLNDVLQRPDLAELVPLKFYVARRDETRVNNPVSLSTGRLSIPGAALNSRLWATYQPQAEKTVVQYPGDDQPISVVQAPISQKTSIFGGTVTTAHLKVKFGRLPGAFSGPQGAFNSADARLTPPEIAIQAQNCIDIVKSPNVLKAALKVAPPRDMVDRERPDAVEWLRNRLSATFPGDGEIFELRLDGGDAKEDSVLLQAVIDAFLAAMKAPPESPADPNAAAVPPGYLSPYLGSNFNLASAATEYPQAFAAALEQSRQAGQPVIVHFLAHDSEPSQRFVDDVLADEQVVKFIDEHFIPVTIYADDEPALAKKFQVSRVPANFFVFNGNARTGGFAVPATPLAYIVQLQQMYNITTNLASSPIPGEPMPATPPVPVADRPGNDQKPTATLDAGDAVALKVAGAFPEAPLDGVFAIEPAGTLPLGPLYGRVAIAGKTVLEAEAAVKEHLSKTLTDVAVQLTLAPNPATTASDVAAHRNSALSPVEINGLRFLKVFPPSTDVKEISALAERLRGEGNVVTVSLDEDGSTRLTAAQKIEPTPVDPSEPTTRPTFLYDGKTFDQWRDLWKLELNPERRIEAINAMAAFSRAGRGDEALNAILDVAAEYDFSTIDPDDPEGKLQERIIKLFTDYPGAGAYQDPWLPIVLDRMQAAPDKWRPLVDMLLYRCMPPHRTQYPGSPPIMSAANVELLKKAVGDERLDAKILFLTTLNNVAAHDPDVVRMTKEALQSDDVESALKLLSSISFANVDKLPEQLEFLFAAESATRQTARDALARSSGPQVRDAVADKLLAILNDANQSARHADAIRALAMFSGNIHPMSRGQNLSPQKRQEIIDALDKVSREGTPDLLPPALAALQLIYTDPDNSQASARSAFNAERLKLLDDSKPEIEEEKQSLLKGTALGEQRGGGFF